MAAVWILLSCSRSRSATFIPGLAGSGVVPTFLLPPSWLPTTRAWIKGELASGKLSLLEVEEGEVLVVSLVAIFVKRFGTLQGLGTQRAKGGRINW
jgi:hypothetical protein